MPVHQCPLCPLIFEHRSEAEWHLREEHRSRADEAAELRAELGSAERQLDWEYLGQLRSSKATPSVTLLMSTAPAATMTALDAARLRHLAEQARRRLPVEPDRDTPSGVVEDRLSETVAAAQSLATDRGMAILVNKYHLGIITLPFGPRDRHVVEGGFATRDFEYALRRYPRYRVLVLGRHPRVLEGHANQLSEPRTAPIARSTPTIRATAYLDPDTLLSGRVEATGSLPLVIVGNRRDLGRFHRHSRYASDVNVEVHRPRFHKADVPNLIATTLERVQQERQLRAVAELLHADIQSQAVWGLHAAWDAVLDHTADRLWVEHDYAIPGRTRPGVPGVETITERAEPGATDDLVDALLEKAAQNHVQTHLLDRHTLERSEPVAVRVPTHAYDPTLGSLSTSSRTGARANEPSFATASSNSPASSGMGRALKTYSREQ